MGQVSDIILKSIESKQSLFEDSLLISNIEEIVNLIVDCFKKNGKVLFCGNGGSAADAQHLAAELSGRFYLDRKPLFAEALHTNSSYLTAVANDYGYDEVFARLVSAMGRKGDVLIAISTSGNSQNIINAIEAAKKAEMVTVGFTGEKGGKMKDMCTYLVNVPSNDTPRIQECHILVGHIICELVEKKLFQK
ncbi:D-sedoheptulose 7-phosphate isomerase [bacterium]|nr:D-sedoheptulose 7-phosphate isomerase [bacterium]